MPWLGSGVLGASVSRGARLAELAARLFVCARCRAQVVLCSSCDRGQRYCQQACARWARHAHQRAAAHRYQRSPQGRLKHAARQRCWRQRRREQGALGAMSVVRSVTHQGSRPPGGDAPLPACPHEPVDPHQACPHEPVDPHQPRPAASEDAASATPPAPQPQALRCTRCASALSPWLRHGFLRRRRGAVGAHLAAWPPRPRGHGP